MSKDKISDYDPVAAQNTDVGGVNLSEGVMVPSDLNNALREIMSHLADFADGTEAVDVINSPIVKATNTNASESIFYIKILTLIIAFQYDIARKCRAHRYCKG